MRAMSLNNLKRVITNQSSMHTPVVTASMSLDNK